MSVDALRENFHINIVKPIEIEDFLSAQTYRREITQAYEKVCSFKTVSLQSLCKNKIRQGPTPVYGAIGKPCFKSKHTESIIASEVTGDLVDPDFASQNKAHQVDKNDIVITRKGSGTIGRASIFMGDESLNTDDSLFKVSVDEADSAYVVAFLRSYWGQRLLEKGVYGSTGQLSLSSGHVKSLPIVLPAPEVQLYIGNKVRQSQVFRLMFNLKNDALKNIKFSSEVDVILTQSNSNFGFINKSKLTSRLDPNYNKKRSVALLEYLRKNSTPLRELVVSISNGYEDRNFVSNGIDYVTGSELTSGRIDLSASPKISKLSEIPERAFVNDKCVLFVRVGSVGNIGKLSTQDMGAVASSNIINVEFRTEEIASAVFAFFNSEAGKTLLKKISFGVIQSQIGQAELLDLPIPDFFLGKGEYFSGELFQLESYIRQCQSLQDCSITIIEEFIKGNICEQQLIAAQKALESGDDSLDRELLSQLTQTGFLDDGKPMFGDLDQLYDLIAQSKDYMEAEA